MYELRIIFQIIPPVISNQTTTMMTLLNYQDQDSFIIALQY